ncbi:rhodanese-like domain-containing protein [Neolewinella lacunae]|uniref:Rhodanese-like domain-containing protein n=1 Tax=Neolewinella lacunae TaxID=1517758 RepID=A0A923T9L6_9BACT|nr:rhodanese-like domain-containing protein [Neolewinella lacunae]MBC6995681.1 rhodanese-like domain-containing protein [Neolewinella lacunae]MDN3636626.1 rhodanese-like domain-containing protein [Neolewinella lacunae]
MLPRPFRFFQYLTLLFPLLLASCVRAQEVPPRLATGYGPLDDKLSRLVSADANALSAREARSLKNAVFLDAREANEYAVSHLPGARHLGFDAPDYSVLEGLDKNRPLVVYCTVGYRSERAAELLRKRGFTQVHNLYGSLYAWKLAGLPLEDAQGKATNKLHTYNKKWGSFVPDSIGEKVY